METEGFYQIRNHNKCLSQLFPIHLNTYVMGPRTLEIVFLYTLTARESTLHVRI